MSNPGLHKLNRIAYYLMTENITQSEMQSRYDACKMLNKIIKEVRFGIEVKKANAAKRKGRLPK